MLDKGYETIGIFEDDAELTEPVEKLHTFYEEACALEPKWDVLVLGATEWVDSTLASPTIRKPTRFWGTHALLLNRKAAQAALDTHKRLQEKGYAYPADWFYSATILQNNLVAYGPRNSKLIQQKPGLVSAISGKVRR
jgi:GR25 family glycosyltransferase involved in LPS biosynthesis